MKDSASTESERILEVNGHDTLYKKDFWSTENLKYSTPHLRMQKVAYTTNKLARGTECTLLDIGCGPGTLASLLNQNIHYYGIDIAISHPAPNLIETDLLKSPIQFDNRTFDIVVAQGIFEYVGNNQDRKLAEISDLIHRKGTFVTSYVNFDHRRRHIYQPYSNIQHFRDFHEAVERHFRILRIIPTSHNWRHKEPSRRLVRSAGRYINFRIPFASRPLAVQYILVCTPR